MWSSLKISKCPVCEIQMPHHFAHQDSMILDLGQFVFVLDEGTGKIYVQ